MEAQRSHSVQVKFRLVLSLTRKNVMEHHHIVRAVLKQTVLRVTGSVLQRARKIVIPRVVLVITAVHVVVVFVMLHLHVVVWNGPVGNIDHLTLVFLVTRAGKGHRALHVVTLLSKGKDAIVVKFVVMMVGVTRTMRLCVILIETNKYYGF
jgi:hypothetical protein